MLETQVERLRREVTKIDEALRKEPSDEIERIERRIGRWLGRYTAAEKLFTIGVEKNSEGKAVGLKIIEHKEKREWVEKAFGSYLLRTNYTEGTASWYIQLWQAEAAFHGSASSARVSSKYVACRGTHLGVFSVAGSVANTGDVDEGTRLGELCTTVSRRV